MNGTPEVKLQPRGLLLPVGVVLLGAAAAAYGIWSIPDRTWPTLLLNGFYITSLSLSGLFFFTTQRLTGARWSASLRRIPEALAMAMPVVAALLLAILFFGRQIYPWAHAGAFDHVPAWAGKIQYLQTPWVFARTVFTLAGWTLFALLVRRASLQQDQKPQMNLALHARMTNYAAFFVLFFAVTFSLGAYDWVFSLEPNWVSTMFAVYVFAGTFVQGIAGVTLIVVWLKGRELSAQVNEHQLHDMGKMLFAFSTFWAYIWTAQYLLIWYGNIPEEISHFMKRTNGPWLYLFALNFLLNWMVPFIVLLPVSTKRSVKVLRSMCVTLLLGHWLDLYIMIMPASWTSPRLSVLDILIAAGCVALLYLLVVRALQRAPLVPLHDPVLVYEEWHHAEMQQAGEHGLFGAKQ